MVIDLDAPPPVTDRPGRPLRWAGTGTVRPIAILAAVMITLVLGASAAPPPGPRRVLDVSDTSGTFALTASALFTAEFGQAPGRQVTIRRHPLGGGASWTADLPQTAGRLDVVPDARVLIVTPNEVLLTTSVDEVQTSFVDSETGEVLWGTRTDGVLRLTGDSALLTGGTPEAATIRRADLRTGRTLWSRQLGPIVHLDAGDPGNGPIVAVDERYRATVLDLGTGDVLATADLDSPVARFAVVGDRLYQTYQRDGEATLAAYRLPGLDQAWQSRTAPVTRPAWCGTEFLCVTTDDGLVVLDTATGTALWSENRWRTGVDSRTTGLPGPPGIAAAEGDGGPDARRALLDPATGAIRHLLGPGRFAGDRVLSTDDNGRTRILAVQPNGGVRVLGTIEDVATGRCSAVAGRLACPANTGLLSVWELPS